MKRPGLKRTSAGCVQDEVWVFKALLSLDEKIEQGSKKGCLGEMV